MEKYIIDSYNPKTFEKSEIETSLPKELVEKIECVLKEFEGENWYVTPVMVNPINMSVIFGIIERKGTEFGYKYKITISENYA